MSRRSSRRVRPSSTTRSIASQPPAAGKRSAPAGVTGSPSSLQFGIESLERRVLFAINNGTLGDPNSTVLDSAANSGTVEFQQGTPAVTIRVTYHDVVAQLVGLAVGTGDNVMPDVDLVPATLMPPTIVPNIFKIYIAASDLTSFISISEVDALNTSGTPRHENPFSGSVGTLKVNNASSIGDPTFSFSTVGGQVLIGNLYNGTFDANVPLWEPVDDQGNPISAGPLGIYPGSGGAPFTAGIEMAPTNLLTGAPNDISELLIGGTIFGDVSIPAAPAGTAALGASQGGNVGLFYAGEIFTGDADGVFQAPATEADTQTPNFTIGGDVRDLYTYGSIGGDPGGLNVTNGHYFTGFDATIAGTVGDIYQNDGSLLGTFDVQHSPLIYGLPETLYPETEVEYINKGSITVGDDFEGNLLQSDQLYPKLGAPFTNNSATTPQYLGSLTSADPNTGALITDASGNIVYNAYVSGTVQASAPNPETDDYYAIPLMAGQTISITLTNPDAQLNARLLDPDGRVVASDENDVNAAFTLTQPFAYTADRPGEYVIDVRNVAAVQEDSPYSLLISGQGNLGLGTVAANGGAIYDGGYNDGFRVDNGDLGALIAGITISSGTAQGEPANPSSTLTPATTINVANGNLRELMAPSIGLLDPITGLFGFGPFLLVPNGGVGWVDATDPAGFLDLNTNYQPELQYGLNSYQPGTPVGGNFQVIQGAGVMLLDIATDKGIGDILANTVGASNNPGFIEVNADNSGNDGIIDLFDVTGNLGNLAAGGPAIVTNTGGDVRYMTVGGEVFQDSFFGGGSPSSTSYSAGEAATIVDDSGTSMVFTPTGVGSTTTVTDANGNSTVVTTGASLTLQTYGIRDKGGVVVISVASTGGLNVASSGTAGQNSQAEIGLITVSGTAPPVTFASTVTTTANGQTATSSTDKNGEPVLTDTTNTPELTTDAAGNAIDAPLFGVMITGPASTDVLRVVVDGDNNANFIENLTQGGELGGIEVGSVGTILSEGTIGLLRSSTGAALLPSNNFFAIGIAPGNTFPFVAQSSGVVVASNVYNIQAYQGLGNIFVEDSAEFVTANSNVKLSGTTFEGINAPVVADGSLLNVRIGQGILPTGTGLVGLSGLFAMGDIGSVTNAGINSDIRGDIISETKIDNVSLNNGSIIGASIAVIESFDEISPLSSGIIVTGIPSSITAPTYAIGNVNVQGGGGIIGSFFAATSMDSITVGSKGFGILECRIECNGNGVINAITAGGYGIRQVTINAGASLNSLVATGNGSQLSVATFSSDLRQSESANLDPYFDTTPNQLTDLDAFLGTSATHPIITSVTDTGAIADVTAFGTTTLGTVSAQTIRTSIPLLTLASPLNPVIPVLGGSFGANFPMSFAFAGNTGAILVRGIIDGLQLTTGTLGRFVPGGSVSRCGLAVSGAINRLVIHGNYGQTFTSPFSGLTVPDSYIDALGPSGSIGVLKISGALNGDVTANGNIGSITIGGNVVGSITVLGQTKGLALGTIRIGGTLSSGSLVIDGSAKSIITSGSLGSLGDNLTVTGSLGSLSVGSNHGLKGSDLALNLNVEEGLGKLTVFGRIDGAVHVAGNLGKLQVTNDGSSPNIISGAMTVDGAIGTAKVIGGSVAADITANSDIGSFTIRGGSVLANDVITTRIGTLKKFTLIGNHDGGLFGSIDAPNSVNGTILVNGDFGDGTNAASILAYSASKIAITGMMAASTSITTTAGLASLEIDGGLGTGATVTGHPIGKQKIAGINLGTITSD